jgi:hypothetical protein
VAAARETTVDAWGVVLVGGVLLLCSLLVLVYVAMI